MYQAVVLDHTILDAETIVDELNTHHVVVLNSIMDETVELLRKQAQGKMKNWRGKGPDIDYFHPCLMIEGDRCWIATLMHSTKHTLDLNETTRLVQRAVEIWRSRGSAERFLYTNRFTRDLSDYATSC